jgi:NADP-dependent 3-hydroxy acid dehydrogenase YdfG
LDFPTPRKESLMEAPQHKPLAVVSGASSGIGFELAKVFGENGYADTT